MTCTRNCSITEVFPSITSSALGSEPSLSSVALVDHGISPDADDDDNPFYNDNIFVNRSLRNIRGSASKRRMAKRKTSTGETIL